MALDDCGVPTTKRHWVKLVRKCRKIGNMAVIRKAQFTVQQALTTPVQVHTDIQHMVIREWKYPDWVPEEAWHLSRLPTTIPQPMGGTWQPNMDSTSKEWALWLAVNTTECPPGIVMKWDEGLSFWELQGLIFIGQRSPKKEQKPKGFKGDFSESSSERQQSVYKLTVAALFGIPGQYDALVKSLGCMIVDREGPPAWYTGLVDNLTVEDLTHFFAGQGVTLQEADDFYAYASNWLDCAVVTQPTQAETIQSLQEAAAHAV
jgi:hypothetical protein